MSRYLDFRLASEAQRLLFADDDHTVVEIAITVARDMALHGYLAQSEAIIAPIWRTSRSGSGLFSHDFLRNTISAAGIEMLWKSADFRPKGIPGWISLLDELAYTDEQLEMEQRDHFCSDNSVDDVAPADTAQNPKWDYIRESLKVKIGPQTGVRRLPTQETERDCLRNICNHIDEISPPFAPERVGSRPLGIAIDLALKYNDHINTLNIFKRFASRIANLVPDAARELALAQRTGKIVRGTTSLREATGLSTEKAKEITAKLTTALQSRLYHGEPRPHSLLSWETLLAEIEKWEARLQEDEHEDELPFLRPPAAPEQIELAEQQLGISLPQDYKDFLAVSDGLGSFNLAQTTPLLSVNEIFWDVEHHDVRVEYRRFDAPNEK
ncbi:hypothetical protein FRC09_020152, partial [Ceratobasidium sp. 395]